jgi:hypothetical protein
MVIALVFPFAAILGIAFHAGRLCSSAHLVVGGLIQTGASAVLGISHMLTTAIGVDSMVYVATRLRGTSPRDQWYQFNLVQNIRDGLDLFPAYFVISMIAFVVIRLRVRSDSKFNVRLASQPSTITPPGLPNQSMHSDGAASGPAGDFRS